MKRIYVAGKYSADNVLKVLQNIGRGEKAAAKLFSHGFAVFCPWADKDIVIHEPDATYTVDMFRAQSMAWLEVSDAVYVISGTGDGGGVDAEIERAADLDIPVFYSLYKLLNWEQTPA